MSLARAKAQRARVGQVEVIGQRPGRSNMEEELQDCANRLGSLAKDGQPVDMSDFLLPRVCKNCVRTV